MSTKRIPSGYLRNLFGASCLCLLLAPTVSMGQPPVVTETRIVTPATEIAPALRFEDSDGNTLFVYLDFDGHPRDQALFYERSGDDWVLNSRVRVGVPSGMSVRRRGIDIDGDVAAAVDRLDHTLVIFERIDGTWTESAQLYASTIAVALEYVEVSAGRVAVRRIDRDEILVYEKVEGAWQRTQTLVPPAGLDFIYQFGLHGSHLFSAAVSQGGPLSDPSILRFDHDGSAFTHVETLSTDLHPISSVSVNEEHLVVHGIDAEDRSVLELHSQSEGSWTPAGSLFVDGTPFTLDLLGDRLTLRRVENQVHRSQVLWFDGSDWIDEGLPDMGEGSFTNLAADRLVKIDRTHSLQGNVWVADTLIEPAFGEATNFDQEVGSGLAIIDDRLAVGVPGFAEPIGSTDYSRGLVTLHHRAGTAWLPSEPPLQAQGGLGGALAWDSATGRLISGSRQFDASSSVRIYEPVAAGEWSEFSFFAEVAFQQLGTAVDILGDLAVAGAIGDDQAATNAGLVRIYERDPGSDSWAQALDLTASDAAASDFFGYSVALMGETVIAGAINQDGAASNAGAVYVFERSGETWIETQKLEPPGATGSESFGISLDVFGQTLIVGASEADSGQTRTGAVHVYERTGPGQPFGPVQVLRPSDGSGGDHFGRAVAFMDDGARVVVGAPEHDAAGEDAGAVYLFENTGTEGTPPWHELTKLVVSDARPGDGLGRSVAGGSDFLAAAGPKADDGAIDTGMVYVFQLFPPGTPSADLSVTLSDASDPLYGGQSVTYTATAINGGAEAVPGAAIVFSLPEGLEPSSTSGCDEDPSGIPVCTLGTIGPASAAMATLTASSEPDLLGSVETGVSVVFEAPNADPSGDSTTESTLFENGVDLTVEAMGPAGPVRFGQWVSYQVDSSNGGPSSTMAATLELVGSPGLSILEVRGCSTFVDPFCSLPVLAPGESAQIEVDAVIGPSATGTSSFQAIGSSQGTEVGPGDEDALVETALDATPWASFVESHSDGIGGVTGLSGPTSVSVSGDASFVHVVGASGVIATFRRQWPGCGLDFVNAAAAGSLLTKTSADGRLLVSADGSSTLHLYSRDEDGHLALLSTAEEGVDGVGGLDGITDFAWQGEMLVVSSTNPGGVARFSIPPGAPALVFEGADFNYTPNIDYGPIHSIELSESVAPPSSSTRAIWLASETPRIFLITENFTNRATFFATVPTALRALDGSFDERVLYGVAPDSSGLAAFELDDRGDEVARGDVRGLQGMGGVSDVALGPEGLLIYTASPDDHSLGIFYRNSELTVPAPAQFPTDGSNGVEGLAGARAVAVSPTAECVYVVGELDNALSVFEIDVDAIDVELFVDGFESGNTSAWGN